MDIFMNCFSLKSLDLTNFYTNDNFNMYSMFYNCDLLTSLIFSNFKTNNQTNIRNIFYGFISLRYIDISGFVTKTNIQLFDSLPNYCKKLDINNCHKNKKLKANKKENYRKKLKMNLSFDDKLNNEKGQKKLKDINITTKIPKGVIVMTQQKYNKKIRTMIKLSKIYENELENIKNKKTIEIEKENNLKLLFNSINDEINKFKKKIDILIIE